ncbi:hypothetical protein AAGW04_09490 [Pectobacterium aroidearum]|uniref:hypothetical protein n=1 Tax=Pectobacterium aroidearum TaxID=1201031 RepID=UPI0031584A15
MEELKESFKQALSKRIESPLFGFIALSWISANWDNIITVVMSKEAIEKTIEIILNQTDPYHFKRLILPILIGSFLAAVYPYLQLSLEWLHGKALLIKNSKNTNRELNKYQDIIMLSKKKAEADIADEKARTEEKNKLSLQDEKAKTEIEEEKEKQKKAQLNTEALVENYNSLEKEYTQLTNDLFKTQNIYNELIIKCSTIIEEIKKFGAIDNSQSLNEFHTNLNELIKNEISSANETIKSHKTILKKDEGENIKKRITNRASFDYSTNNGILIINNGSDEFSLKFSKASDSTIRLYTSKKINKIARIKKPLSNHEIILENYDSSSDHYMINKGEMFLAVHDSGKILAGKIIDIKDDSRNHEHDNVEFDYVIYNKNEPIISL